MKKFTINTRQFLGEDGLDELKEDLNPCQIMYALVRIQDPKTNLTKFVLLHWQGSGVQILRQGLAATHFREIEKYFPGVHLTFHARNEEEIDESAIMDKVSKTNKDTL